MIQEDDSSFIALFLAHPVPMWVYDLETLRFLSVNTAAIVHYGYTEAEFLGMTIEDIRPRRELSSLRTNLRSAPLHTIEKAGVWRHLTKDGTHIDVEITSHPLSFKGRNCKFVLALDVTERLLAQSKVGRLNRIYAVLSRINSTIVRVRERAALFHETCRIATMEGGFVTACIGEIDPHTLEGTTVAIAGSDMHLLEHMRLTAREGTSDSAWPACRAVRRRVPVICNDIHADPALADLLERIGEQRHYALAAFPLFAGERVAGVLILVAATADYFDNAEMTLLNELAADVSFALQFIEREEEHRRMTSRLQESEAGLRRAQLTNRSGHVISAPDGTFESWSETLPLLIGVEDADMPPTTRDWLALVHPDDRERFRLACIDAGRQGVRTGVEYRIRRGDNTMRELRQVLEPLPGYFSPDGKMRWFNTIQDVTEQKQQQFRNERLSRIYALSSGINSAIVRIRERGELFQEACRVAVHDGAFSMAWIGVIDPDTLDGTVVAWSGGAPGIVEKIRVTGRDDVPERTRPASLSVREKRPVVCNDIANDPVMVFAAPELLARGHRSTVALPLIRDGRAVAVFALLSDVTGFFDAAELKLLDGVVGDLNFAMQFIDAQEQLSYLAYYDALTGLANGKLFEDRLTQFMQVCKTDQHHVAVVLINVDRFAQLNDALGRRAGDEVLKKIAKRLGESLQGAFSLARISGATFAIAIADLNHGTDVARILEQQIFAPLGPALRMEQQEVRISARAGLALFPGDGQSAEVLFKHAEVALKNAKTSNARYAYYAPAMNAAHSARLELETELQHALDTQQFDVYFQPRVDLASGRIVSAEALIRWCHPQRGMVSPVSFIPLAEETGLIVPIGLWVLNRVCAQQAAWLRQGLEVVPVAVNLSAMQFKHGSMLEAVRDALGAHGLAPKHIEFELTESMVMNDPDEAAFYLKALKDLGTRLALDDFGTGYSSLAYLQRFPFDFVKIDRSFISNITSNPSDAAIVTAVIALAHSLHLRVVAEGVETEGQLRFLRKLRCDEMQGYFFSPAVPAPAFEAMLREAKQLPALDHAGGDVDTLLIVDDEPNNLAAIRRSLRREGYHLLTASSGQEGLRLLAENTVQVIISDQRMPHMSGSAFLRIVKELYPDTIRIILSGYTDLAAVTDSVNQGAVFKFMTKPWDDADLRENIRGAFRRYRQFTSSKDLA